MAGLLVLSLDCSDYAMENFEFSLKKSFKHYKLWFFEYVGFALGLGLLFLIPGLNILLLPIIVISATYLVGSLQIKKNLNG